VADEEKDRIGDAEPILSKQAQLAEAEDAYGIVRDSA
jgi:hypothetical protein